MRARFLLLPLLLAGASAAVLHGTSTPDDDLDLRIDAAARSTMQAGEADGLAVAADLAGRPACRRAWGAAASVEASVRAGALTETFLAVCALQLVDEDKVDPDASVAKLLPDLGLDEAITVRHVLMHTSGLPSYGLYAAGRRRAGRAPSAEEVLAWVAASPLDATPGTCVEVTDTNVLVLGTLVENLDSRPASAAIAARVFARAGMEDTRYRDEPPALAGEEKAAREVGGELIAAPDAPVFFRGDELCSTADDLVRFVRAFDEGKLLGASQELLRARTRLADGTPIPRTPGFEIAALERIPGRSSGGALAGGRVHVAWYGGVDLAIAVVADGPDARLDLLERRIARMLLGLSEPGVLDEPISLADRLRFVGSYYVGCSEYRVMDDGERLYVQPPAGSRYTLLFQGGLRFKSAVNPDTEIEFLADDESVYAFYLTERGSRVEGRRM